MLTESSTTQAAVVDRLATTDLRRTFAPGTELARDRTDVLIESDVVDVLARLNPIIAANPHYADEILPKLRAVVLSADGDGLMAANERMMRWLRGHAEHQFVGKAHPAPVRLVHF